MVSLLLPIIYVAFISLGLPDSLLGSAWPSMYPQLGVPVSYAGIISMIISLGTIISSLNSDRLTRALGTGKVTAISVGMTAAALFGFSVSGQFWMLCLWAIPYGLGAGSVDAALNNYVALHYESRHMSWLHCLWGIGTMISPMVMGAALAGGMPWTSGYRYIALFQILLTAVLFVSLPLWQKRTVGTSGKEAAPTALTFGQVLALAGLVLVGLGCAPIYPSIIHSTPDHFGAERSQAVIGIQMASAYVGNLAMPPLFGLLANNITPALFPFYLLVLLLLMVFMHEQLVRKTSR